MKYLVGGLVLLTVAAVSLAVGSRSILPPGQLYDLLLHPDGSIDAVVLRSLRLPRTVLGLLVGAALGVAGALMQSMTRNPLADPGLLGVNAGAAVAMVAGFLLVGADSTAGQLSWSFGGAAIATVLVYGVAAGGSPVRLVLAGAAVSAALFGVVQGVILLDPIALDRFRYWAVGALAGRESGVAAVVAVPIVAGLLVALLLGRALNALALGDDVARGLGVHIGTVRVLALLSVTVLCGAATAAAGPVSFVGLAVPYLARRLGGTDLRRVLAWSVLIGPLLLLVADVLGRLIDRPAEVGVGVVAAFLGAPLLIAVVRRPGTLR